jgi:hypothetical protein
MPYMMRHEPSAAVDHRRVHHLPAPAAAALEHRAHETEGEIQRTATEITGEVQRRHRRLPPFEPIVCSTPVRAM